MLVKELLDIKTSKEQLETYNREEPRTPEEDDYFAGKVEGTFGVNLWDHPELSEFLLDFAEDGASAATMRLLARLQP